MIVIYRQYYILLYTEYTAVKAMLKFNYKSLGTCEKYFFSKDLMLPIFLRTFYNLYFIPTLLLHCWLFFFQYRGIL